jgi:UDPglucose 6-dehydrogenase
MQIAIIGTGYVGLVTGTCFAETGNDVICLDVDQRKIDLLQQGQVPIYEPGLAELVARNSELGRLHFTTDPAAAIKPAEIVFLAVGTPGAEDGSADLTNLWAVVDTLAGLLADNAIVITKSTVPVGTNAGVFKRLLELTGRDFDVVSNPEFLKEGAALDDFMRPDRVVIGVRSPRPVDRLRELYAPFLRVEQPFLVMSPESAEMTKYVANAMLATKISFINEIANLCEHMEADINDVRRGIGHDSRIGFSFMFPGVGYGGSCFPKDVRALQMMARSLGVEPRILAAVDGTNTRQKTVLLEKIVRHFGGQLAGKTLGVWGLAFKPRTDDIREAPALALIDRLLAEKVVVQVHDPEALENVQRQYGDRLTYATRPYDAINGADALLIMTEWKEFQNPDFKLMKRKMKAPVIFDGRNIYDPAAISAGGFTYYSIGRASVLHKP